MQTDFDKLADYYRSYHGECGEQHRLQRDQAHTIEFITSMHLLLKHLPKGCSVLDCCAAEGAYAFPLAKEGYRVTAGDLIKEHVEILQRKNSNSLLENIYHGNVLDMSEFSNESFGSVLCMGALYHLMEQQEREKCVAECLRVLKKDGVFAFAYLNRNAQYIADFNANPSAIETQKVILETGKHGMFYAMDFNEPQELADKFPLTKITDAGVDGLIYPLKSILNEITPDEFSAYMEYHISTCEQPSIIGHSIHGLWIGRKQS